MPGFPWTRACQPQHRRPGTWPPGSSGLAARLAAIAIIAAGGHPRVTTLPTNVRALADVRRPRSATAVPGTRLIAGATEVVFALIGCAAPLAGRATIPEVGAGPERPARTTCLVDADPPCITTHPALGAHLATGLDDGAGLAEAVLTAPVADGAIAQALVALARPAGARQATLRRTHALLLPIAGEAVGTCCAGHAVRPAEARIVNEALARVARTIRTAAVGTVVGITLAAPVIAQGIQVITDHAVRPVQATGTVILA
jgi:hypothetical protein